MANALNPCSDASLAAQSVAYTGTAGSTSGWSYGPTCVLVWATTDCYVRVGNGATATSADLPLPSYTPIEIRIPNPAGAGATLWRVSAIQISAGGTIYAKPMQD
jgi:hypothetical protein